MKRAIILVPLLMVSLLISVVSGIGYLLVSALGIPTKLGMPPGIRLIGLFVLAIGFFLLFWVFKYRPFSDILVSTYDSIKSVIRKRDNIGLEQRIEPLIITGPHRFLRHPIYSAVILMLAGWWLLMDFTILLFCAGLMALWFRLVVIPFEERELRALFGTQYEIYAQKTPRFIPSIIWRRPGKPQ